MESPVKKVADHPKVSVMVDAAIKTLAEPKGSSLHAINKYINANYNVDIKKLSVFIKKYLKSAVERGDMVQPTGKGATGSFKISKTKVEVKPKTAKVKSTKSLKLLTSTPNKNLKPKKATIKSPNKSPVKKMKLTDDDEGTPGDASFSKPKTKIKKTKISLPTKPRKSKGLLPAKVKPKKLMAKKDKPKISASPKEKSKKTITSPKIVKTKSTAKATKVKKSPKPKKPAASKKAAAKGVSLKIGQK